MAKIETKADATHRFRAKFPSPYLAAFQDQPCRIAGKVGEMLKVTFADGSWILAFRGQIIPL